MADVKIGIVTDSHMGGFDDQIVEALKREGLDLVAYLGDAPSNLRGHPQQQFDELATTLQAYDKVDTPVFWIPGNYEDFQAYHVAFQQLEDSLDNVTDATRLGRYTLRKNGTDVDLVFVPGARDFSRGFHVIDQAKTGDYDTKNGPAHVFNPYDLERLVTKPEGTIVFAHSPIKMEGDGTFDVSMRADYRGQEVVGPAAHQLIKEGRAKPKIVHVGNELLGRILDKTGARKFFSGDIHEAAYTTDRRGNPIPNGSYSMELFGNPGPAMNGRYGVLVYRDDKMATLHAKTVGSR
jgi:predicted phosphodiesterase